MCRLVFMLVAAAMLGGCATSDRFTYGRQDPFIWFLSGMPAPYDLNWPKNTVPELPVLNPPDYTPIAPMQPLDYPRGWNPDHPPLISPDAGTPSPTTDAGVDARDAAPQPAPCSDACDGVTPLLAPHADARADVREPAAGPVARR
ncbi:MAG: hypothetical protein ABI881_09995 [Betaproteobacteria bacterium]